MAPRVVLLLLLSVLVGCGGRRTTSGDGGAPGDGTSGGGAVALSEFCARLAAAECAGSERCCTDAAMQFASHDACIASRTSKCAALYGGVAFTDGRVHYDAARAGAAFGVADAASVSCGAAGAPATGAPFMGVFMGTLGEGQDCSAAGADLSPLLACMPGWGCMVDTSLHGACHQLGSGGTGDSCASSPCRGGEFCNEMEVCEPPRPLGSACMIMDACASFVCTAGACAPPPGNAAFCLMH